jgi:hypothetical protein
MPAALQAFGYCGAECIGPRLGKQPGRGSRNRRCGKATSMASARTGGNSTHSARHVLVVAARSRTLRLTMLVARKDLRRHPRVAARWLSRYLDEHPAATIEEAGPGRLLPGRIAVRELSGGRASAKDHGRNGH